MPRKRKAKKHDNHIDESWLIPYADILTLLLALFIVLFSMSSIDAEKFQQIARSFNGIFSGQSGMLDVNYPEFVPEEFPNIGKSKVDHNKLKQQYFQEQTGLKDIQTKINAYIEKNDLQGSLKTTLTDEGLLVTLSEGVLFDSGSAVVREEDKKIAREVSKLLVMNPPRHIIISGHTDNVPIHNSQYRSNWQLSVMRSVNFMEILLENKNLDPRWFSAKGYGEFSPIASNATPEGRKKNRRVEILILPNETNEATQ